MIRKWMCDNGNCGMKEKSWRSGQYKREGEYEGKEKTLDGFWNLERKWGVVEVCVCVEAP